MVDYIRTVARIVFATLLLLFSGNIQAADETTSFDEPNTYWDKGTDNPTKHTLTRRMALVGHNCMVSRLADGIEVGTGSANLSALCDEDLTNAYTIPSVASVTLLAGSPIAAVKDMKHYFSKDTKAGFKISGQSDVLKLNVLQSTYRINFYKDGECIHTSGVEQKGFTVLNLSVGDINIGSDAVDVIASSQPDQEYDEIALVGIDGVDLSVAKGLEIYYAFVGDAEYSLTNTRIKDYDPNMTVSADKSTSHATKKYLCDDDLTNSTIISAGLQLGSSGAAYAIATSSSTPKGEEAFPAGTEAGFVYSTGGLLDIAPTPVIYLVDKDGKELYHKAINSTVLAVNLSGGDKKVSIKAPCAFSGIKLMVYGVQLASGIGAKYAFVVPEPTTAGHQCEMSPAANVELCSCDARYKMTWDKKNFPDATWSMVNSTDENVRLNTITNADGTKDYVLDFSNTEAYEQETDQKEKVTVLMRITNTDGCKQDVTINYGGTSEPSASDPANRKATILANSADGTATYELGESTSVGIDILKYFKNASNIISSKFNSFASYIGGITSGDINLCSIHKKEGLISDGSKAVQTGFVVTAKTSGLSADVLKFWNVRLYKDGKEVSGGVVSSAIGAKLIGSEDTHKVRYSINVPAGVSFDEIRLCSTGLLSANLSQMNIYYAYTADKEAVLDDPTLGATIVSYDNTGASIDADRTQSIGVANVGNGLLNITNSIDNDLNTCATFPTGLKAVSGSVLGIKLGRTATRNKQLVVVVNKEVVGLGLDVAGAIVVKTWKDGKEDPVETYDDWSVLGANVISSGDKGYIFINPTQEYDAVTITEGKGISLLDGLAVYGLLLRNDKDGNGVADDDELDDECQQDLVFQETVNPVTSKASKTYRGKQTMYFQRTFVGGEDNGEGKWNSLILPVNLTKAQFTELFGSDAKLAQANNLYKKVGKDKDGNTLEQRIIGFEIVPDPTHESDAFLVANTPYIIYMTKEAIEGHQNLSYQNTWDAGDISGEIYKLDKDSEAGGVTYGTAETRVNTGEVDFKNPFVTEWKLTKLAFKGSYEPKQSLAAGDYIFNNGDMYHLTQSGHTMKAFRCWLTPVYETSSDANAAKAFSFGFDGNETTGIDNVHANRLDNKSQKVYNMNGQQIDSLLGVQPGIYIVGGKKVVIK
jgi:hypothetical protein